MTQVGDGGSKAREGGAKIKLTIGLSEAAKDRVFELKEITGAAGAAQVAREALRVYDILVTEVMENGAEIILVKPPSKRIAVNIKLF